jgi:prepilin-type N-terminal cleavage/methylation domain-containing protein
MSLHCPQTNKSLGPVVYNQKMTLLSLRKTSRGFTLIELLIVIAIIGILSSVVMASLSMSRQKARDAKRLAQIKEFRNALAVYHDEFGTYPSTTPGSFTGDDAGIEELVRVGIISTLPIPPLGGGGTTYVYRGMMSDDTECEVAGEQCDKFALGITLERDDNVSLLGDSDTDGSAFTNAVYGGSEDCLVSPLGGAEKCFDVQQ